jgi:MFS transporter, FHS family, glucose/mannose:H+ symporter
MSRAAPLPAAAGAGGAAWIAACAALTAIGIYTAALGPLLPDLAARSGVTLGDAGALYSALFGAAMVSTLTAGRLIDRVGVRPVAAAGLAINSAGLALLSVAPSWPLTLMAMAVLGLGDGATIVALHVLAARLRAGHEAATLNTLNVFFGLGAIAGPALVAALRLSPAPALALPAMLAAVQLAGAAATYRDRAARSGDTGQPAGERPAGGRPWTAPLLWLLAVLLLIYVGAELGLGAWAFTLARGAAGLGDTAAALLTSAFWAALTLGRLLSPLALRRVSDATLLLGGTVLALAGTLLLTLGGGQPVLLVAAIVITGVGYGPVWPVTFALAARAFPRTAGSAGGLLAMMSTVGGIAVPWLQGRLIAGAGPSAGIAVTLTATAILVALALVTMRAVARHRAAC